MPHFGVDLDIKDAQASIAEAETTLGHKWVPEQDDEGNYIVPEAASNQSYDYDSANAANVVGNRYA